MIMLNFVGCVLSLGLVSSCHLPSWVFRVSKTFSRGYIVGTKYFLVHISWAPKFFSFFMGLNFFLAHISWVQVFLPGQFYFQLLAVWEKGTYKYIYVYLKLRILFQIDFKNIVNSACIRKVLHLLNYLSYYAAYVCTSCIFSHLFLGNRISSLVIERYILLAKLDYGCIVKF